MSQANTSSIVLIQALGINWTCHKSLTFHHLSGFTDYFWVVIVVDCFHVDVLDQGSNFEASFRLIQLNEVFIIGL